MPKVLVVGDAVVDIIVPYPKFLNHERTMLEYPTPCLQGGGTSANTAVALSRLGIPTSFLGTIGEDQYGKYICGDFAAEGIDTSQLIVDPALNTVGVFAFIDETGERYLWGWPRVDQAFKVIDRSRVDFDVVRTADWVHSSGMSLVYDTSARHTIMEIFRTAWDAGIPTSFDLNLRVDNGEIKPAYRSAIMEIIESCAYVLGSGKEEFYYLGEGADWMKTAQSFASEKRTVILRNGKEGSVGISPGQEVAAPAYPVEVVDTVGAGDVYNAGFITAKLQGCSLRECLSFGNAAAGYTVSGKGARNCPHYDELVNFMRNYEALPSANQ